MQSGALRHRVELQRVTVAADSHGDQVKSWATLAEVWAEVLDLTGREFVQASQVMADVTVQVRLRGRADFRLTPKDRIVFGDRTFDIRHVTDMGGKNAEWRLLCTERYE